MAQQSGLKERRNHLTELITRTDSAYENIDKFLPMVMAMAKDVEIDDVLIAEARWMAKEFAG